MNVMEMKTEERFTVVVICRVPRDINVISGK
jgi:hypothetical protein